MVARAAFGIEEAEKILEGVGVGAIPEVGAFATHGDEVFVFELVEVVRERGIRDVDLGLNITDDHAFGFGAHQKLHDAEARFGAHGGEHVGETGDLSRCWVCHVSMIPEIWNNRPGAWGGLFYVAFSRRFVLFDYQFKIEPTTTSDVFQGVYRRG